MLAPTTLSKSLRADRRGGSVAAETVAEYLIKSIDRDDDRIGADGKLDFARKYDVDTAAGTQFWCGFLNMP